jgi:cobalt-zinc-cadmium resistance protein CzcA
VASIEDIANIVMANVDGTPIRVKNVATSKSAVSCAGRGHRKRPRSGARHVFMLIGENSRTVSQPSPASWSRSTVTAKGVVA